jgi:WD40 repeat protein
MAPILRRSVRGAGVAMGVAGGDVGGAGQVLSDTRAHDKTVRLWNADTGAPLSEPFTGHTDVVSSVAFSPDGQRVVSASFDHTLRLWPAHATPKTLCPVKASQPAGPREQRC